MKAGDFVQIEYTGKVKETGEIFDTTDEALAKNNGIFSRGTRYGPVTIILGAHYVIPGLDKKLISHSPDSSAIIEVLPDDAFGKRDAQLIHIVSLEQFRRQRMVPVPGQYITLGNNVSGKILSVTSGRVKVDFNHPLSGKTLQYEVKIHALVEDAKKRVQAITGFYLGNFSGAAEESVSGEKAEISLPKDILNIVSKDMKEKISEDIKKYVSGVSEISFSEKKETKENSQKEPEIHENPTN